MRSGSQKKKKSIFLRLSLLAFAVYVIVMLVQLQLQIQQRQQDIDTLAAQAEELTRLNEDQQHLLDNPDRYLEQQARAKGYVLPGEDVFKESPF